jgi:hypothetical protein
MNSYSETQLAFVNLECLFPPEQQVESLSVRREVPKGIHPLAERALGLLAMAKYREILFYWPQPLELFPQAVRWLKQYGLRDVWHGTAGQGETRPLTLMSSHFDQSNGTWEHLHWEAALLQQTLTDRQIVERIFLLDPLAGHVASYVGEQSSRLYSCEIFTALSIEEMFQMEELQSF